MELFGEAGEDAVKKELTQLHERGELAPKELNDGKRKAALQYLMFLKQKRVTLCFILPEKSEEKYS